MVLVALLHPSLLSVSTLADRCVSRMTEGFSYCSKRTRPENTIVKYEIARRVVVRSIPSFRYTYIARSGNLTAIIIAFARDVPTRAEFAALSHL
jgi:hypothetical protein